MHHRYALLKFCLHLLHQSNLHYVDDSASLHWLLTLRLVQHGPEGADDVISLQLDDLVFVFQPLAFLILLGATELHPRDPSVLHDDLTWGQEGQELTLLLLGQLHLMGNNTRKEGR